MNVSHIRNVRNAGAQGGFTLIELIVVIVILGILAATALPKFADLSGDARFGTMRAAEASIRSVAAMAHARALTSNNQSAVMTFEDTTLTLVNGYPPATADLAAAAGLSTTDYRATPVGTTLEIRPAGVAADSTTCVLTYAQAANTANARPTFTLTATPAGC